MYRTEAAGFVSTSPTPADLCVTFGTHRRRSPARHEPLPFKFLYFFIFSAETGPAVFGPRPTNGGHARVFWKKSGRQTADLSLSLCVCLSLYLSGSIDPRLFTAGWRERRLKLSRHPPAAPSQRKLDERPIEQDKGQQRPPLGWGRVDLPVYVFYLLSWEDAVQLLLLAAAYIYAGI